MKVFTLEVVTLLVYLIRPSENLQLKLINANSPEEARSKCQPGTLKLPSTLPLSCGESLLGCFSENGTINLWNGYYLQTPWLENRGCFKLNESVVTNESVKSGTDVASCWTFCRNNSRSNFRFDIGLGNSTCKCMSRNTHPRQTSSVCSICKQTPLTSNQQACGSVDYYSIYRVNNNITYKGSGHSYCLLFNSAGSWREGNCNESKYTNATLCGVRPRSGRNNITKVSEAGSSWFESHGACIQHNGTHLLSQRSLRGTRYKTRLMNFFDVTFWANERIYYAHIAQLDQSLQRDADISCITLFRNDTHLQKGTGCSEHNMTYLCVQGSEETPKNNDCTLYDLIFHSIDNTPPRTVLCAAKSDTSAISRDITTDAITIGLISVAVVVVVLIVAGILIYVQRRYHGQNKEHRSVGKRNGKPTKAKGVNNVRYCSGAVVDILAGNPDRNSQHAYTTIADKDLKDEKVNGGTKADKAYEGQTVASSSAEDHSYFVLTPAKDLNKNVPNDPVSSPYDLAKPLSESIQETNHVANRFEMPIVGQENTEYYDHLNQEAYNVKEPENTYAHTDCGETYGGAILSMPWSTETYGKIANIIQPSLEADDYAHAQY